MYIGHIQSVRYIIVNLGGIVVVDLRIGVIGTGAIGEDHIRRITNVITGAIPTGNWSKASHLNLDELIIN